MGPARYERDIANTTARYARAAERFTRAMADWRLAEVPVLVDDTVPYWTVRQREVCWRVADAFADLVTSHRAWEKVLEDLGHQR